MACFLRDAGLVLQFLHRRQLANAGFSTPPSTPAALRAVALIARRLVAVAASRGWAALTALLVPALSADRLGGAATAAPRLATVPLPAEPAPPPVPAQAVTPPASPRAAALAVPAKRPPASASPPSGSQPSVSPPALSLLVRPLRRDGSCVSAATVELSPRAPAAAGK